MVYDICWQPVAVAATGKAGDKQTTGESSCSPTERRPADHSLAHSECWAADGPDCRAALMAHFVPPSYTPFSCDSPPAMIELQSRSRPAHHSVLAAEPQCRLPLWDGWAGQTARHRRRLHLHHPPGRIRKTFLTACTDHSRPTLAPHPGTNHQPGLHSQSSH